MTELVEKVKVSPLSRMVTIFSLLLPSFFLFGHGGETAGLERIRAGREFFDVRLFSKFIEREMQVWDEHKGVVVATLLDSGKIKIVGPKGTTEIDGEEGLVFPVGVYHLTPRAHRGYARRYKGGLTIKKQPFSVRDRTLRLETIMRVDEEDYTMSVVASERVPASGVEAQKALAICVRSFARYRLQTENKKILSDLTEDQVFKGLDVIDVESSRAVTATTGEVLVTKNHQYFPAYYSSTCGTMTTTPATVWKGNLFEPYFQAVTNAAPVSGTWLDGDSPHSVWKFRLPAATVAEIFLNEWGSLSSAYTNEKLMSVSFGQKYLTGWNFRQEVCLRHGWLSMKSLECRFARLPNGDWEISGKGLGHGVGMSVYGSAKLASLGWAYRDILGFYFPRLLN